MGSRDRRRRLSARTLVGACGISFAVLGGYVRTGAAAAPPCRPSGMHIVSSAPVPPDTTSPTVSLQAPTAGTTVSGTSVAVSACAADNVAIVGVQFKLDGANLGAEDIKPPYSITWNTTTAANGGHTLTAVARDPSGNVLTSPAVAVVVSNGPATVTLSAITAVSITTTGAQITWLTNLQSDSQVDYGLTTAYGSSTTLNTSPVTAHSASLSGLAAGTLYHYRVRSKTTAGSSAISSDFTFTTTVVVVSGWPHQPVGFVPVTDWAMAALTGSGWNINNPNGYASIVSDTGAISSAPAVGQWKYPAGFAGGSAPATMYYPLPSAFDEGFVGVSWKASNPWNGHPSYVNKIYFLLGGSCGNLIPIMYGPPGGPYDLRVAPEWGSSWNFLTPNVNNVPVALGVWHKIELYFKYNTPGAGIVRWWMDGTLIGNYTNVTFPSSGCFAEFQFSPTWGGVGGNKAETDYFWYDHAYISLPAIK